MNEHTEARMLLERALGTEPEIGLDAGHVLEYARRGVRRRRAAMIGAAATAVVGVTLTAVAVIAPAGPGTNAAAPPSPPPPTSSTSVLECIATAPAKECVEITPLPPVRTDEVTKRLTDAFAAANVIPAGLQVAKGPSSRGEPLVFVRDFGDAPVMAARLQDGQGWGVLTVLVSDNLAPGYNLTRCTPGTGVISCEERTMPDGSKARVTVAKGMVGVPGSTAVRLTVLRANGSFVDARVSNDGDSPDDPSSTKPPTRPTPPLTVEQMFRIGAIAGLTL